MLVELHVRDLGVISDLRLTFGPGMTALTGETGAGKTLLVEAIELLTGGRAEPMLVRPGAAEAVVEGRFLTGEGELIMTRVVPAQGRSRAYLDGRMAQASALAEAAEALVDLHGQHSHQSLLRASGQRAALDAFASVDLGPLRQARARLDSCEKALEDLGGDERARARELDLLAFQLQDIEGAALVDPGEDERLEAEEDLLASATEHRAAAAEAHESLAGETGAAEALAAAQARLGRGGPFGAAGARLRALSAELDDLASELRRLAEEIADDPARLDEVRARRQLLRELRRKYGDSLEDVMAFADSARARREELASHAATVARLEAEREDARAAVAEAERLVGKARRAAAPELSKAIEAHFGDLAMAGARLEIEVGEQDPGDEVTFLLAANPGQPALPLAKVASGGELARAMLAARLVLTQGPPVLVFDEVDAGVGGQAAVAVGRALASLAPPHQVLVVTHLAQVAAFADHQVAVTKVVAGGQTSTTAEPVTDDGRLVELSRMLSGHPDSDAARRHAEELLASGRRGQRRRR